MDVARPVLVRYRSAGERAGGRDHEFHAKGVAYNHRATLLHALVVLTADALALDERGVEVLGVPILHANGCGLPSISFAS
jgi:hypothetical protein